MREMLGASDRARKRTPDWRICRTWRMGAAKLALETGTTLQPAYIFGNSQPLSVWYDRGGRLQGLSRRLRCMLAPVWGRWGMPVPRRAALTWALGEALHVPKHELQIGTDRVEAVHRELLARIEGVYAMYAGAYGWAERDLRFV